VLANRAARRLFGVFMVNGIASAIPATLFLFFVADRLALATRGDLLLAAYFLAAAVSLPLWVALARRIGRAQAWRAGMLLAIAAFAWAFTLGPGDFAPFLVICVATGVALGADLSMPPALLADVIAADGAEADAGAHFGVWNLINKLNLALAAGLALPLVEWLGYRAGTPADGFALPAVYCLLPCGLKLIACAALTRMNTRFETFSLPARS
jgi:Na+/melibiose symporter-like transporter